MSTNNLVSWDEYAYRLLLYVDMSDKYLDMHLFYVDIKVIYAYKIHVNINKMNFNIYTYIWILQLYNLSKYFE